MAHEDHAQDAEGMAPDPIDPAGGDRSTWVADAVFAAVVVAAFPLYLVAGRDQWFFQDEWMMLAARDGGSLDGLLSPHNEHWSTVPVVLYRLLFNLVGLRSYLPYQVIAILGHLTAAALLRVVIRRSVSSPWIATAGASAFVLLGAGSENIIWAFQVAWTVSLALGLAQLLLADHPSPSAPRTVAGIGCGLGALASSGVGVTMVIAVGVALLLRHGWRRAALNTVPLGLIYLAWFATYGRDGVDARDPDPIEVLRFALNGLRNVGNALGRVTPLAVLLAALAIAGLVLVGRAGGVTALRRDAGIPIAMLSAAVLFFLLTGYGRSGSFPIWFATRPRYAYIGAALVIPAIALGADRIARAAPRAHPVLVVVLLLGIPGNIGTIEPRSNPELTQGLVEALANPDFAGVPDSYAPFADQTGARAITMGWLRETRASGRLDEPGDDRALQQASRRLALYPDADRPVPGRCRPLTHPYTLRLDAGDTFGFSGSVRLHPRTDSDRSEHAELTLDSSGLVAVVAGRGPLRVEITPVGHRPARLCT